MDVEMWAAWSDTFGFVANSIGVHEQRELIDDRIAEHMKSDQAVRRFAPGACDRAS